MYRTDIYGSKNSAEKQKNKHPLCPSNIIPSSHDNFNVSTTHLYRFSSCSCVLHDMHMATAEFERTWKLPFRSEGHFMQAAFPG
jgi:hypothetical protein